MMRLISRETLDAEWPWILATVRKALKGSPERLYRQLDCGSSVAMHVSGVADGVLILHAAPSGKGQVMWVAYAAGKITGPVKRRLATIQAMFRLLKHAAKTSGCTEIRVEGESRRLRQWARVLTGFVLTELGGVAVLRMQIEA